MMKHSIHPLQNGVRHALRLFVGALLITAFGTAYSSDTFKLHVSGTAPAYQVGAYQSHNRFCYDGSCIIHGAGQIDINLDPESNSGNIEATFSGSDGKWKIVANKFKMIKTDVNLHGATGGDIDPKMSPPVLPQVWTYVATWGPAAVFHNGKLAWKGAGHLMVTEEVRDPATGKVDFKGPMKAKAYPGSVHNKHAMQVHFVAHPMEKPTKGYLPPYKSFVHLMYETVTWQ